MNLHVQITLDIPMTDEETEEFELGLKLNNVSLEEHVSKQIEKMLTHEADIPKESIKEIKVRGV